MDNKIWKLINSQVFIVLVGFILTGIIGHYLTSSYQDQSWIRDKKHQIFKQELADVKETLESLNKLVSTRLYSLQKVHWALERKDKDDIRNQWEEYNQVKDTWNIQVVIYKNKLRRLFQGDLHDDLLAHESLLDEDKNIELSLHSSFRKNHNKTKFWVDCYIVEEKCENADWLEIDAHNALNDVYIQSNKFIDKSYAIYIEKYHQYRNDVSVQFGPNK